MAVQVTEKMIYTALEGVMDPELPHSIVELGFVRDIDIIDDWVRIDIQLTTPHCPYADQIVTAIREAVSCLKGVREVEVHRVCEQEA
jgi:metal-sulfur cluster biosynthetic enzyme